MCKKDAIKDLKAVKVILDRIGCPFFLNFGTLLGAIREKDFIEGDRDIDLGIIGNERRDEIRQCLKEAGFTQNDKVNRVVISAKRKVGFDFHFYVDETGPVLIARATGDVILYGFPKVYLEFIEIMFKGDSYLVPMQFESYLKWLYGDWRTPNSNPVKPYRP